ncbi:MAG: hypothetical protein SGPRY_009369 [Prymnesium sp.]
MASGRGLCALLGAGALLHVCLSLLSVHSSADPSLPLSTPHTHAHQASHAAHTQPLEQPARALSPSVSGASPQPTHADKCYASPHAEFDGPVVLWGSSNLVGSAEECCAACREHRYGKGAAQPCMYWVYCGAEEGCGSQKKGECWGKARRDSPQLTSGVCLIVRLRSKRESCTLDEGWLIESGANEKHAPVITERHAYSHD